MFDPEARKGRVGILISGRGSNMKALVESMESGRIDALPAVVISNVADAAGLAFARGRGIPTEILDHRDFPGREAHERRIAEVLTTHEVDLVCLAGYMRLLSKTLVAAFRGRILNVHPALLPAFRGLDAQRQALEFGVKLAGCTVHFVDEEVDHGPIVLQASVPVQEDDDESTLSERILALEHQIYPEAVALYFRGRLRIEGRRVAILPA